MEITYLGHASFKIKTKTLTLVTDPFDSEMVGQSFPKVSAEVVTISHQHPDHSKVEAVEGSPLIIAGPGEYEIKGTKILGISSYHDKLQGKERGENTIYRLESEGIVLVHLGDLGHKLEERIQELIDGVDILLIPVGGVYTINAKEASEIVSSLEPKIVIPMHYRTEKINKENFGRLDGVEVFLREMGKEGIQPIPKLNISKDKLPTELNITVLA